MKKETKIALVKYSVTIVLSALVTYLFVKDQDTSTKVKLYHSLCDGFFIPGIMLACMGTLCFLANTGSFDGIGWALNFTFKTLIPFGRLKKQQKYGDYVEKRRANPIKGYYFLLHVGIVDIGIALVFLALFHSVY